MQLVSFNPSPTARYFSPAVYCSYHPRMKQRFIRYDKFCQACCFCFYRYDAVYVRVVAETFVPLFNFKFSYRSGIGFAVPEGICDMRCVCSNVFYLKRDPNYNSICKLSWRQSNKTNFCLLGRTYRATSQEMLKISTAFSKTRWRSTLFVACVSCGFAKCFCSDVLSGWWTVHVFSASLSEYAMLNASRTAAKISIGRNGWTRSRLVNTPCFHLHNLWATGVSSGLATRVTLTRVLPGGWEMHYAGGVLTSDLIVVPYCEIVLCCVLNSTSSTSINKILLCGWICTEMQSRIECSVSSISRRSLFHFLHVTAITHLLRVGRGDAVFLSRCCK
jgi:hypothetical protein